MQNEVDIHTDIYLYMKMKKKIKLSFAKKKAENKMNSSHKICKNN